MNSDQSIAPADIIRNISHANLYCKTIIPKSFGERVIYNIVGQGDHRCSTARPLLDEYEQMVKIIYSDLVDMLKESLSAPDDNQDVSDILSSIKLSYDSVGNKFYHSVNIKQANRRDWINLGGSFCEGKGTSHSVMYHSLNHFVGYLNDFVQEGKIDFNKYNYNNLDLTNDNDNNLCRQARGPLGIISTLELVTPLLKRVIGMNSYELADGISAEAEFVNRKNRIDAIASWLISLKSPCVAMHKYTSDVYSKRMFDKNSASHKNLAFDGSSNNFGYVSLYAPGVDKDNIPRFNEAFLFSTINSGEPFKVGHLFKSSFFGSTGNEKFENAHNSLSIALFKANENCMALCAISDLASFTLSCTSFAFKPTDPLSGTVKSLFTSDGIRYVDFISHVAGEKFNRFDAKLRLQGCSINSLLKAFPDLEVGKTKVEIPTAILCKNVKGSNRVYNNNIYSNIETFNSLFNYGCMFNAIISFNGMISHNAGTFSLNAVIQAYVLQSMSAQAQQQSGDNIDKLIGLLETVEESEDDIIMSEDDIEIDE